MGCPVGTGGHCAQPEGVPPAAAAEGKSACDQGVARMEGHQVLCSPHLSLSAMSSADGRFSEVLSLLPNCQIKDVSINWNFHAGSGPQLLGRDCSKSSSACGAAGCSAVFCPGAISFGESTRSLQT